MDVHEFIKERKYLIWYVGNYDALDDASIVEATLNYGDWNDVQLLIQILGIKRVAEIFKEYAFRPRTNYRPEIRNYFNLYFNKYA